MLGLEGFMYTLYFNILARKCEDPIPEPYLGIDVVWKNKNRDLGAKIDYVCPFRRATETLTLKGKLYFSK